MKRKGAQSESTSCPAGHCSSDRGGRPGARSPCPVGRERRTCHRLGGGFRRLDHRHLGPERGRSRHAELHRQPRRRGHGPERQRPQRGLRRPPEPHEPVRDGEDLHDLGKGPPGPRHRRIRRGTVRRQARLRVDRQHHDVGGGVDHGHGPVDRAGTRPGHAVPGLHRHGRPPHRRPGSPHPVHVPRGRCARHGRRSDAASRRHRRAAERLRGRNRAVGGARGDHRPDGCRGPRRHAQSGDHEPHGRMERRIRRRLDALRSRRDVYGVGVGPPARPGGHSRRHQPRCEPAGRDQRVPVDRGPHHRRCRLGAIDRNLHERPGAPRRNGLRRGGCRRGRPDPRRRPHHRAVRRAPDGPRARHGADRQRFRRRHAPRLDHPPDGVGRSAVSPSRPTRRTPAPTPRGHRAAPRRVRVRSATWRRSWCRV